MVIITEQCLLFGLTYKDDMFDLVSSQSYMPRVPAFDLHLLSSKPLLLAFEASSFVLQFVLVFHVHLKRYESQLK